MLLLSPLVGMLFWNLTRQWIATKVFLQHFAINILLMLRSIMLLTMAIPLDAEDCSTLVLLACSVPDDSCKIILVLIRVFSNPDCCLRFRGGSAGTLPI